MNSRTKYLSLTVSGIAVFLLIGLFFRIEYIGGNAGKKAYIVNQNVYEAFHGRMELEEKLNKLRETNRGQLDSLKHLAIQNPADQVLAYNYQDATKRLMEQEKAMAEKYQMDIWKQINQYVEQFGKENNYDFIFGAMGNGNLMYARGSKNITSEVIQFINDHYEDKH